MKNNSIKKMTVLGMGNQGKYNYFIVKKEKGFLEWLSKVYSEGAMEVAYDVMLYEDVEIGGKTKSKKRNVVKIYDLHETYPTSETGRLDVFYGKEKIFLTLYASGSERKKFIKSLEKQSDFLE